MFNKFKTYLESIKVTPISWLVGISGVLVARFFLESLSNPTSSGFFASDAPTLIHYYLFFLAVAVVFMIFLQKVLPSWKHIMPQLMAVSFPVIFIAPIIDWIISGGKGLKMLYLFDSPIGIFLSFLSFTNWSSGGGSTFGLQIEIAVVLLFSGLFVYLVSKNWKRAIVSALILYTIIFIFASLPGVVSIVAQGFHPVQNPLAFLESSIASSSTVGNNIHGTLQYTSVTRFIEVSFDFIMGKILFLILVVSASTWFYLNFKEKFKAMIKNSRPERVAHYIIMIFFGIFVAFSIFPSIKLNWDDWLSVIVLCLSFYFSIMFAVCINDIVDEDIDAISNINRPLITNSLNKDDMKQSGALFLVASLFAGFLAGYTAFFFLLTFTALYYIYSASPTRLKLIPFFSSFLIGLCSLTAVLSGFFMIYPLKYVSAFPHKLILAVIVIFFLGSHIRDMKDVEGDKAADVKTVPVIFGDIWGPRVVGIFVGLAFLLVPIFSGLHILFITAIPGALASYYFVVRKNYKEKYIFETYFAFVLASLLLLVFF